MKFKDFPGGVQQVTPIVVTIIVVLVSISCSYLFFRRNKLYTFKSLLQLYEKKHAYEELDEKIEVNEKGDNNNNEEGKKEKKMFLNNKTTNITLQYVITLTKTVKIFIFSYPNEYKYLGLGICKHLKFSCTNVQGKIRGKWNNKEDVEKNLNKIFRSYTPVYIDKKNNLIHFIIRVYHPDAQFIDGGKLSTYLNRMSIKTNVEINGPYGLLEYKGNNNFVYLSKQLKITKHLVLIAGGTGMTPFFRLLNHLLFSEKDKEKHIYITFIYANRNEDEILLKSVFDGYEEQFTNFKRVYSVDTCLRSSNKNLFENIGYLNIDILKKYILKFEKLDIPIKKKDTLVLLCGPPPMTAFIKTIIKDQMEMQNFIIL
ncbi:NADH-cytochrome b5 reductase, putative [Hepatocystis sp. ex Piliocolobus tephrosceles]|nr:NADH-cytochrome b5 reductase, putative [Hepatocystis sp. ex Piliocolobus tephrosceles]